MRVTFAEAEILPKENMVKILGKGEQPICCVYLLGWYIQDLRQYLFFYIWLIPKKLFYETVFVFIQILNLLQNDLN